MNLWTLRNKESKSYNEVSDFSKIKEDLTSLSSEVKAHATKNEIIATFTSPEKIQMKWWFSLEEWYIIKNEWAEKTPTNTLNEWDLTKIMNNMSNYEIWLAA